MVSASQMPLTVINESMKSLTKFWFRKTPQCAEDKGNVTGLQGLS